MSDSRSKVASSFLLLLILALPVAFMWQGLDVTDTGYYLVNCQQFFNAYPNDFGDAQSTAYWLTNFVGACWYKLTGECGVFGFRVLYVLLNYCALGVAYLGLRGFRREQILLGLLAAEAICIGKGVYIPSYNQVTAVFFAGSAVALYHGLVRRAGVLVFVAGTIAGISVFARIVNVPIGLLAAGVWYYQYVAAPPAQQSFLGSLKQSTPELARFLAGFACGVGIIVLLIGALGHLGAFRQMLVGLFGVASDAKTGYSPAHLLKAFAWDYFHAGLCALGFMALALIVGSVARKMTGAVPKALWAAGWAAAATVALLKWPDLNVWAVPGMLYVLLLAAACGVLGGKAEFRLLCVLAGIVLFVIPLGSADGMNNSIYGMYLAVPAALMALVTAGARGEVNSVAPATTGETLSAVAPGSAHDAPGWVGLINLVKRSFSAKIDAGGVAWICAFAIICFSLVHRYGFTYRDSPDRSAMTASVNHPKLRAVFTTRSRARALQELLTQLEPLVRKDDYLMDHMQMPLLYFVTEARPYLFTSWANLNQPSGFQRLFQRALAARSSFPVCVKTKVDTCHPKWPDETYPLLQTYRFAENRQAVDSFLQAHNYRKSWENDAFEIWTTSEQKSAHRLSER